MATHLANVTDGRTSDGLIFRKAHGDTLQSYVHQTRTKAAYFTQIAKIFCTAAYVVMLR